MKRIVIGVHLLAEDVTPPAEALPTASGVFLSTLALDADQSITDRDLMLRVAAARAALLEHATFIAVRYGFIVNDAEDPSMKIAAMADGWKRLLQERRDYVEMTLKVVVQSATSRPDRREFTSGADYLRALHAAVPKIDDSFRTAVAKQFEPFMQQWSVRDAGSLECAFLIQRSEVDRVNREGERLREQFPQTPFLLSGPWPLEQFADDRDE